MRSGGSSFVRAAANRPVTVAMMFLAVLVVGAIAYRRIPIQQFPSGFTPRFLFVGVPYTGGTPREVELEITRPVEEALGTVAGIERVNSSSSPTGATFWIVFKDDADMDVAFSQVVDRMERLKGDFPAETGRYRLWKFNLQNRPVMTVGVALGQTGPERRTAARMAAGHALIENLVVKPLERIDGVARVEARGVLSEEVQIQVNEHLMRSLRVNLYRLAQRLSAENFVMPAGSVEVGARQLHVRSVARFADAADIARYPVSERLRLGDVARVGRAYSYNSISRINGREAMNFAIHKSAAANTVEVCRRIRRAIDGFGRDPRLASLQFMVMHDQGRTIEESLDNLQETAGWGALIAVGILFVFLRQIGMTAVITLAIPISLVMALGTIYFTGETLNLLTLMGLTLSVGMVVDNSVVVVENIQRLGAGGASPEESAVRGAGEVALAVFIATSTTLVVFLPLALMGEDRHIRFFMARMGLPVCYALAASLLVALVFIPPAARLLAGSRGPGGLVPRFVRSPLGWLDRAAAWALDALCRAYARTLRWSLGHRLDSVAIFLVPALVLTGWLSLNVERTDRVQSERRDFNIVYRFLDVHDLEFANRVVRAMEERLEADRKRLDIENFHSYFSERWGRTKVFLGEGSRETLERKEIIKRVEALFPAEPGVRITIGWQHGAGDTASQGVPVILEGPDSVTLAELAEEAMARLRGIEGLVGLETELEGGYDEIVVKVDRGAAQRYGVDPRSLVGTIAYALRGTRVGKFEAAGKEVDIRLKFERAAEYDLKDLADMGIRTRNGNEIPLAAVARLVPRKGFANIHRADGKTILRIEAKTTRDDLETMQAEVASRMAGMSFPRGYSWRLGGRFEEMDRSRKGARFVMALSILFVFVLMGVLFESVVIPFAILTSIPFAMFGVFGMLYVTGTPMGMMSSIGLVLLVGVVINNGVVLVDLVHRLRREGAGRTEAIVEGGRHRLRPILMTAATTIGGLVPMALGAAKVVGVPYYPLAIAVIGGLAASTVFTLLAVPLFYSLLDDLRERARSLGAILLGGVRS